MDYPVSSPSKLERLLFDNCLVEKVKLAEIYDIKACTRIQQAWLDSNYHTRQRHSNVVDDWNDKLYSSSRGEFFVKAFSDCEHVLDVGCGEGWPSLYLAQTLVFDKHILTPRDNQN
jgi:2-polyprenyl-3-methyl-5-hydroxy-6-metoxy-1,4-benzoquinol methylase